MSARELLDQAVPEATALNFHLSESDSFFRLSQSDGMPCHQQCKDPKFKGFVVYNSS